MNNLKIRKYKPEDFDGLSKCQAELQETVAKLDQLKIYKRRKDFDAKKYTQSILKDVKKSRGIIIVAEIGKTIVGIAKGEIHKSTKNDELERHAFKYGITHELVVLPKFQGRGIGQALLTAMEEIFEKRHCTHCALDVAANNHKARQLYEKNHYADRYTRMMKKL